MDNELFLQHLRDLSLEEGKAYIQEHIADLADQDAVGVLIKGEALRQWHINTLISLKLGELLVFFGEHVHHSPSRALGFVAKGDALKLMGHHQAAIECLDRAGEEFLRLGDELGWARTRMSWIISATWLGRVEEALQEAARARDVFLRYDEHYWVCGVNHNIAMIYKRQGRYQEACNIYERVRSIYPTLTDQSETVIKRAIAMAEANEAINLSLLGKFEHAYRLLAHAQETFNALGEVGAVVKIEAHLAELDYVQGYYGSALQRYYQARDSMLQHNTVAGPMSLTELTLRIADCLVKLNRANEACQLADEVVKVYKQLGISLDTGEALCEYATTLVASARPGEALIALDEAEALFSQGGFDHYASATKLQRAELLLTIGSAKAAYDQAHLVKEFFDTRGLVSHSVRASLVMIGALIERAKQKEKPQEEEFVSLQEARLLCEEATFQAGQYNLQEQVYKGQYLLGKLAALQGNSKRAVNHYKASIAQIERILDDLVHDLSPAFLRTAWAVYEDMIVLCLQQDQTEQAFSYLERARSVVLRQYLNKSKASFDQEEGSGKVVATSASQAKSATVLQVQSEIEEWQQEYRKYSLQFANYDASASPALDQAIIQAELKRCEAKLSELFERLHLCELNAHSMSRLSRPRKARSKIHTVQQVAVEQLRKHLSSNQLLLTYFLCQGKLTIFAATAEHLIAREHFNSAAQSELERLLPLLHAHLQPGGWPDPQRPPQQSVRRLLHKLYDLLIGPVVDLLPPATGHLTIVPYGPLHNLPFHALYNGSHFLIEDFQISYLPASSILTQLDTLKSVRDDHGTKVSLKRPLVFGYSGNGQLQRALEEAKTLAKLLDGRCYLENEATIARLFKEAPGSSIIHLATHGQSRLDAPNFSSVLLADGQLNALDAFSLDLSGCELVTLSGCETGLALSGGGDEQLGLGRAFLAAGAASLVMSLWPVEDNATNELMKLFYQSLLQGDSKVQALRTAQSFLVNQVSSAYTHPYFWAAFRLVGEFGPLHLDRAMNSSFAGEAILQKNRF